MRIVVTGATGNLGTSCLQVLAEDARVSRIVAIARRAPRTSFDKTQFVERDVGKDVLEDEIEGADTVIHLAWELRPSHNRAALWWNNVEGSTRVFSAAARTVVALARLLNSRTLPIPAAALRALVSAAWTLRLQPSEPGFVDLAFKAPLLSAERAKRELGWHPLCRSERALSELLDGLRDGAGFDTPRLHARKRAAERHLAPGHS